MAQFEHKKIAQELFTAAQSAQPLSRFTARLPAFSLSDGYQVQNCLADLHLQAGETIVGRKMGMTSRPKMLQMGIHSPIHGFLTNRMQVAEGGELSLQGRIHAKVEPEIGFLIGKALAGRPSLAEAMAAVDSVVAALEVIDSRYENFDFQLPDVVADNCSSSGFVVGGERRRPHALDLANLGIVLESNGRLQQCGSSAAILGHPGRSLVELVRLLGEEGRALAPGDLVLAGAATAAIPLQSGQWVRARFADLGVVELRVKA